MSLQEKVLEIFKEINSIPRCSGNEKAISDWLVKLAKENQWQVIQDDVLNVIIKVSGKNELINSRPVVLQGHMDMVCVKEQNSNHDFCKDAIEMYEKEGWLKAKGTTLGADNGIALAIALAIAMSNNISHPPLELLFTVDEERGLTGANALQSNILQGKYLLNIDSEDEGVFTIGCAGGRDTHIELPLNFEENSQKIQTYKISVNNLSGGHSGIQIIQQKPNAIHLISRVLNKIIDKSNNFYLCSIEGGIAHNAIPSNACAVFASRDDLIVKNIINEMFNNYEKEYRETEAGMSLSFEIVNNPGKFMTEETSIKSVLMLTALPHGVFTMSSKMDKLVETSNNLAQVKVIDNKLQVLLSQRSSVASQLDFITDKIESVAKICGANVFTGNGYPAWEPDWNSYLLKQTKLSYKNIFGYEPKIEVIHAGLECGVIGAKYPGMEMISFGPTIKTPHTPHEKMYIPDIDKIIIFLLELFKNL